MLARLIRKLLYGLTVLWGVVTLVFIIFNTKPGDPAQMIVGQRATPEMIEAIRTDLGFDLPFHKRYLLYLNDLSPLSIHDSQNQDSRLYFDQAEYNGWQIFGLGEHSLFLKRPYLRRSYQSKRNVSEIIAEAFPATALLAISAIGLALIFGIAIGIISAVWKDSFFDRSALVLAVTGMAAPSFYMAILISWIAGFLWYEQLSLPALPIMLMVGAGIIGYLTNKEQGSWKRGAEWALKGLIWGISIWGAWTLLSLVFGWKWSPFEGLAIHLPGTYLPQAGSLYDIDVFKGQYLAPRNLILPMITLGIRPLAVIAQLMRNSLLEELNQDYIRTARAKGANAWRVVFGHAFRNALNPLLTAVSGWFASMLAGAVFIEFVFGWQGLGLRIYEALIKEDFPLVMGSVIVISSIFVLINLLVDILYGILDPRIAHTN